MKNRAARAAILGLAVVVGSVAAAVAPASAQDSPPDYSACERQDAVPAQECYGVAALYVTTDGGGWNDATNWLDFTDVCSWYGVGCADGHVVELRLSDNNLEGTLPVELAQLHALESLRLRNNAISGTIPLELGGLHALTDLDLAANQLEGSIPIELALATRLRSVNLSSNAISGTIPTELGGLAMLRLLDLSANDIAGTIPRELGDLVELETLALPDNDLSGVIPTELAALVKLRALDVSRNRIEGTVPIEFAAALVLAELGVEGNVDLAAVDPSIIETLERNRGESSDGADLGVGELNVTPEESVPDQALAFALPEVRPNAVGRSAFAVMMVIFAGLSLFAERRRTS